MRFELSEIFNYREKLFYLKSLRFFKLLSYICNIVGYFSFNIFNC